MRHALCVELARKPVCDPFECLLRDGSQDVPERRCGIFDVSLKMNRPHEPRVNSEQ